MAENTSESLLAIAVHEQTKEMADLGKDVVRLVTKVETQDRRITKLEASLTWGVRAVLGGIIGILAAAVIALIKLT